jgi:hypothetical protein
MITDAFQDVFGRSFYIRSCIKIPPNYAVGGICIVWNSAYQPNYRQIKSAAEYHQAVE